MPVIEAISIAAGGLAAQSQRIEGAARAVASMGAAAPTRGFAGSHGPVRVGALPVGDPAESIVTLVEAQTAYRANAAVLSAAAGMLDTLLDVISPRP